MLITNDVALITFVPFTFTVLGMLGVRNIVQTCSGVLSQIQTRTAALFCQIYCLSRFNTKCGSDYVDAFGHKQLQGTSAYLANFLGAEIGCKTRFTINGW